MSRRYRFGRLLSAKVLLVALLLPLLIGIPATVQQTRAAQDEQVTLNLWTFLDGTGFLESVVKAFEEQNPNIKISITDVPEDDYVTKIDTAFLAGQPPDIGFPYTSRWMKAGYFLPLDDAVAAGEIPLDDYNAGAISRNCYIDGHLYCVGSYTGGTMLFYNKDMFDAAGVPYPTLDPPLTIDQYAELAQKLTIANDDPAKKVWGATGPQPWWMEVSNYYSEDGRTADGLVNDEATAHFFQVAADMFRNGIGLTVTEAGPQAADLLASGQVAMAVGDSVVFQPLLEQAGFRWGAVAPPVEKAGDKPWVYTGSDELGVFKGSAHPEEAMKFVIFYGTVGNQMRLDADGLPLNMKLAEEGNWAGDSEGRQEMLAAAQSARPTVFVPEWYFVYDYLDEALNGRMVEDGATAQDALNEIAPDVQSDLDQKWETWEQIQPIS